MPTITKITAAAILTAALGTLLPPASRADCADDNPKISTYNEYSPLRPRTPISSNSQKITKSLNGITFTSNYDNGSLQNITTGTGTDVYTGTLFAEDSSIGLGTKQYHFRFKMTGTANRTITINMSHSDNIRPVISYDGTTWRRMTAAEAPNLSTMIVTCDNTQNFVELAFYDPLGYQEIHDRVNQICATGVGATTEVLGQSTQGRDMWLVTVTDPAYPASAKHRIWLHARAHSGEVTASWNMLGFLTQVTENSDLGRRLRRFCIFNIVPTENVDGVYLGLTRWSSDGHDLEREWQYTTPVAEVANMKAKVLQFMATSNPIEVALNLHSTVSLFNDSFFFKHVTGSGCGVTANFEIIQQRYIDNLDTETTLFNNADPQTSCLDPVKFIESFFWYTYGESVMAMTHEGHYYYRTATSNTVFNTGNDYFNVGKAMASCLITYASLPVPVHLTELTIE